MNAILTLFRKRPVLSLAGVNAFLLLVLFIQHNPLNLQFLRSGYSGADVLLNVEEEDVERIEISDPDYAGGRVILERGDELPENLWQQPEGNMAEESWLDSIITRVPAQYNWKLTIIDANGERQTYSADHERVRILFDGLKRMRDYFALDRTPEKDRDLGMGLDTRGQYTGLQLSFQLEGGRRVENIYVGRSSTRGNQSYVRMNEEDEVFLVEANPRSFVGSGEKEYFRSRNVLPALSLDTIQGLKADMPTRDLEVEIARRANEWQMILPLPTIAQKETFEALLGDILNWQATGFPESIPEDLDPDFACELDLQVQSTGQLTGQSNIHVSILGRVGYSDYIIQRNDQLMRINSIYLADLYEPRERLLDAGPMPGGGVPGGIQ
ncbi:MAG: DUF4340 domain-containing protein [Leptospiraceae bacterium]|nr:DUF4340 domain-containing protein [Leptospiraceae bacterium]